uniref:Uncharacterized protein n=1 Tax=Coturnix japonica TaxID=93934 RepID=A0A8C2TDX7_COTJA
MNVEHEISLLVEEIRRLGTKSKHCNVSDHVDIVMLFHHPMNLANLTKGLRYCITCMFNMGLHAIPSHPSFKVILS